MKIPFSWLKEYVDIPCTAHALAEKLFTCGFEVEQVIDLSAEISRVVVGHITAIQKQEGTDHLSLCRVDCGPYGSDIAITCGASNIFVGAYVPAALDGATLPGGVTIKKRSMQGIESGGMLCSGTELGLTDDLYPASEVNGLLILQGAPAPGTDICEVVGLNDFVLDISITANRPDCHSILGMAREVSALLGSPLKMPATDFSITAQGDPTIQVQLQAPDLCPRYLAHYVRNLRPAQSPAWLRRHLALCGIRSIYNVVDITNYVLLEIGQPMHAFDLARLQGRQIVVRRAQNGETITTLDEKQFTLTEQNLVIADAQSPVCIAGVMGGLHSGITDKSTELLFECAAFRRDTVRKTGRSLGQVSDSSLRYEKGVDQYSTELGLARALHLVCQLDCGDVTPTAFDCGAKSPARRTLCVTAQQINGVLGITVPTAAMVDILTRLDFGVTQTQKGLQLTIPRYREDVEGYQDIAEEIIREYGYHHIQPTFMPTAAVTSGGLTVAQKQQRKLKEILCAQGCFEASTLAFYSAAQLDMLQLAPDAPERRAVRLQNPISENLSLLRTLLAPSMLTVIVENLKKGNTSGRLFELANVYLPKALPVAEKPQERLTLSVGTFGDEEDFFALKGILQAVETAFRVRFDYTRAEVCWLHPGISAEVRCGGQKIGVFGKLANEVTAALKIAKDEKNNQNIYLAELDYTALCACFGGAVQYKPLPAAAPAVRDLALVCDEAVSCGALQQTIQAASALVSEVRLFDIYRGQSIGEGKKSMAFTVVFGGGQQPCEGQEVERAVKKILADLQYKKGAVLR